MDVNESIIFIEKSVFLEDDFFYLLEKIFNKQKTKIYVENDLDGAIINYKNTGQLRKAYTLEGFVDYLSNLRVLRYIDTRAFLDLSEIEAIIRNNPFSKIMLITQKEHLFTSLNLLKEKYAYISITKYINGQLVEWHQETKSFNSAFYIDQDKYLNKVEIDKIDYVYSPKYGYLRLDKSKALEGGEGVLYRTYNNLLCKLYFTDHQTYVNYKKLQDMLEMDIYNPYINWPKDIIYYKNDFIGYVMEEVSDAVSLDVLRAGMFEGYSVLDLYILTYNLLQNINYLHNKNIIIGDLKLDNILVKSKDEVYLVDCGCYQINDYPCDVCNNEYTKRLYTGDELKKTLRTFEDEYYPINVIIFEILIGKKPYYNRNSGEIDVENRDNFAFPLDLNEITEYTHELKMWKMLSERMRKYFYYYFKENKITYLTDWLYELKDFIDKAMQMKVNKK